MHKITRLITEPLKGKNEKGHRISCGQAGSKITVFETKDGKLKTDKGEIFEEEEFKNKTVSIVNENKHGFSINDIFINLQDRSLDLKAVLPEKISGLLSLLGVKRDQIPKETYSKIMNVQDIVNFYGKPIHRDTDKFAYDRLIDLFGDGVDRNSNGIIGEGLKPDWIHPKKTIIDPKLD